MILSIFLTLGAIAACLYFIQSAPVAFLAICASLFFGAQAIHFLGQDKHSSGTDAPGPGPRPVKTGGKRP